MPPVSITDSFFSEEAHIQRYLVVTGAGGVEFTPHITDDFNQPGFHGHVDIFQFRFELKITLFYLFTDRSQPFNNRFSIGFGNNTLFGKHFSMGDAAFNVFMVQNMIKPYRSAVFFRQLIGGLAKAAANMSHLGPPQPLF